MAEALPRAADVVVIGGGIIGCAIAYELARMGVDTLLLEAGTLARGASGASAGGVRQQGRDPRELPLARQAVARWPSLAEELGCPTGFLRCGHLTLAESPQALAVLAERCERERAYGIDARLVDAADVQTLAPGVAPHVVGGSWTPDDGQAVPALATVAFAQAARRFGARIIVGCRVTGIRQAANRVVGVDTPFGSLACNWIINAAGAWSAHLARLAGRVLNVVPRALQMLVTVPVSHRPLPVLGALNRRLSFKQLADGSYLIGGGWPGIVAGPRSVLLPASLQGSARDACAIYPPVAQIPLRRAWAGIEGFTPDGVPVVGPDPDLAGFVYACGFCGHGFALAPAVGEVVARFIRTGQLDPVILPFRPDRFGVVA